MRGEHQWHYTLPFGTQGSSPHARGARARPARRTTCPRDHPRMRGEHRLACSMPIERQGSSPHARGARGVVQHVEVRAGIIPACAGSTCRLPRTSRSGRDHPRMRGEHNDELVRTVLVPGSSPHARGALWYQPLPGVSPGIIPACAGSTALRLRRVEVARDHPRMRGEHATDYLFARVPMGSSPHARGAPLGTGAVLRQLGIIPACAGSTVLSRSISCSEKDHPRMRGEHSRAVFAAARHPGSSPHARGALYGPTGNGDAARDHPRMRGEHPPTRLEVVGSPGSSPHARGAPLAGAHCTRCEGIIPACAGSTWCPSRRRATRWDHPRMRGEHSPSMETLTMR